MCNQKHLGSLTKCLSSSPAGGHQDDQEGEDPERSDKVIFNEEETNTLLGNE